MLSNNFTYIILEGSDGVGKTSLVPYIYEHFKRRYIVEDRGDISEFVYAQKYNRPMRKYGHNMPMLYVVLTRSIDEIVRNIRSRTTHDALDNRITTEEEIQKANDSLLFTRAAAILKDEYNIISVDITGLSIPDSANKVAVEIEKYIASIPHDKQMNQFNLMYEKGCNKFGLKWYTINNQPYLENQMIMADFQYHNGMFETYDDKTIPHNLLFSAAYENTQICTANEFKNKQFDFEYPINSKILFRPEVKDYVKTISNSLSIYTTESNYLDNIANMENTAMFGKVFGDDYIKQLSKAKATVYTSRELATIEMMTVRCYEATMANNVIFVDALTDPHRKILKQIHGDNDELIDMLTVIPENVVNKYSNIVSNIDLVMQILKAQHEWYNNLLKNIDIAKIKEIVA